MGKAPAFQFYPSDWQRDMDDHPLEIEGAWIRICCRLYWCGGSATKTVSEWSRILRQKGSKTRQIISYLELKQIADVTYLDKQITITSRRIVRDEYIRKIRQEAGNKGGNPRLLNDVNLDKQSLQNGDKQNLTPSSSSLQSSSSSTTKEEKPSRHSVAIYTDLFEKFWTCYPDRNGKKVGKRACFDLFQHADNGDREEIIKAAGNYACSKQAQDNFAKDPERFLKKDFWRDWIETGSGDESDAIVERMKRDWRATHEPT